VGIPVEMNYYLALTAAVAYLDLGPQGQAQFVFQFPRITVVVTLAVLTTPLGVSFYTRGQDLHLPYGQTFVEYPLAKFLLNGLVPGGKQRPGVSRRDCST